MSRIIKLSAALRR